MMTNYGLCVWEWSGCGLGVWDDDVAITIYHQGGGVIFCVRYWDV